MFFIVELMFITGASKDILETPRTTAPTDAEIQLAENNIVSDILSSVFK